MMKSAVVVIGRNEGLRLERCLKSVREQCRTLVYVDSGSEDRSIWIAESLGASVISLDSSLEFSAARARNEGFSLVNKISRHTEFVQFVDGDCEIDKDWLGIAEDFLEENSDYAVVAGRIKEKSPEKSIYNKLCDIEWNTNFGDVEAVGGIFLVRSSAFREVQGFNQDLIAGEEPEMCYRLRNAGWKIKRLKNPMAGHDAAIYHFKQWWNRAKRTGHAYAHGFYIHRRDGSGYYLREMVKGWIWSIVFPFFIALSALIYNPKTLILFGIYPLQILRMGLLQARYSDVKSSLLYGLFTMIAKFPQLTGQLLFFRRKFLRKQYSIIEYK